jgi:hypothetical protein
MLQTLVTVGSLLLSFGGEVIKNPHKYLSIYEQSKIATTAGEWATQCLCSAHTHVAAGLVFVWQQSTGLLLCLPTQNGLAVVSFECTHWATVRWCAALEAWGVEMGSLTMALAGCV